MFRCYVPRPLSSTTASEDSGLRRPPVSTSMAYAHRSENSSDVTNSLTGA